MYTNINTITNYVLREIDNDFEVQIEDWIEAMSRFIDNETGREIYRADTKVRKYDGNGKYQIMVDDFVGNPIVTVNGEVVTTTSSPANTDSKFLLSSEKGFPRGLQNVEVEAQFSYTSEVPRDIEFACTVLVAGIIEGQIEDNEDVIESETIGNYQVKLRSKKHVSDYAQAMQILKSYRKITI